MNKQIAFGIWLSSNYNTTRHANEWWDYQDGVKTFYNTKELYEKFKETDEYAVVFERNLFKRMFFLACFFVVIFGVLAQIEHDKAEELTDMMNQNYRTLQDHFQYRP